GLDDFQYQHRGASDRFPDRYAFSLLATGPLHGKISWRAGYTQASSLAFRTQNADENFTEHGVGLGRSFADDDPVQFMAYSPIARHGLVTPELTLLRQGQGHIDDPVPVSDVAAGKVPTLFIGTVERTFRAALGLSGKHGAVGITANAGIHFVHNAANVAGR